MTQELTAIELEEPSSSELFQTVLDMAQAAKSGNTSGWLAARYSGLALEDLAYTCTEMLGILIENNAIREGVHPADMWRRLRAAGVDEFG
ncbi:MULTISPECIES: hypothetical protein [unclassified Rhodococcus (in: high G+C Gram-positive bacteria)]|uniref:hypothetical protein n=1 Tax=Rhodococcus sp. SJ-3 TaxID=3454628 RepID=UPI003F78EBB0